MQASYASNETTEIIRWSRRERRLNEDDVTDFFDAPLPRISIFHSVTSRFALPRHAGHASFRIVLSGEERYDIDGRRVSVRAGEALMINGGQVYASSIDTAHTETLSIFVPEGELEGATAAARTDEVHLLDRLDEEWSTSLPQTPLRASDPLLARVARLCGSLRESDVSEATEDARIVLADAIALAVQCRPAHPFDRVRRASVRDELMWRLLRARDFIEDMRGSDCTLEHLAVIACLSPHHFLRRFTEAFEQTPVAYARRVRLRHAAAQVATGKPLAEAALTAGYASVGSFQRAWRRSFQDPPPV